MPMSEKKLEYKISEKYSSELLEISTKLEQIRSGRVIGINGAQMDGSLAHNVDQLENMITDLLNKIQEGKPSNEEILGVEISSKIK
jgi:hypothetical protein